MGCTPNAELQKRGHPESSILCHEPRVHPAIKYDISLFLKKKSVLLQFMHSHRISHEAPTEIHIDIKVAIPLIFMTLITLLWLSIALFWQHVFTRSMQQKIKAPVKVYPFSVVCFLIGQDYCALTSQCLAEQAPGCMNIRHFMTSSLFR